MSRYGKRESLLNIYNILDIAYKGLPLTDCRRIVRDSSSGVQRDSVRIRKGRFRTLRSDRHHSYVHVRMSVSELDTSLRA